MTANQAQYQNISNEIELKKVCLSAFKAYDEWRGHVLDCSRCESGFDCGTADGLEDKFLRLKKQAIQLIGVVRE